MPCWGRLMGVYLLYGLLMCAIALIFAALIWWYKPSFWYGPEELARSMTAAARIYYFVALINFYSQSWCWKASACAKPGPVAASS